MIEGRCAVVQVGHELGPTGLRGRFAGEGLVFATLLMRAGWCVHALRSSETVATRSVTAIG